MSIQHKLSKTSFTYGCQCLKRLYLNKHHKKINISKDSLSDSQAHVLHVGTSIGMLAQSRFPGGVDCTPENHFDYSKSLQLTANLISSGQPVIYEAAFVTHGVLCAVDIMVHSPCGWDIYEVKSTTRTKKQHKVDAALQYWVLEKCGIRVSTVNLMHLNSSYVKTEESIDVHQLFKWDDVTADVKKMQQYVTDQVALQTATLDIEDCMPNVAVGPHCSAPYKCDFYSHCLKAEDLPEYSVLDLSYGYGKQWELLRKGVKRIVDIPDDFPLTNLAQKVQIECEKSGTPVINRAELQLFLDKLEYPLYFLDFETIMSAVPLFANSRAYQQLCFQYSIHVQPSSPSAATTTHHSASVCSVGAVGTTAVAPAGVSVIRTTDERLTSGEIRHCEYLAPCENVDPRPELLARLVADVGSTGSIIVYNQSFEESRLLEMSIDFPEQAEALQGMIARLVDLAVPFQKKHFYCREMHGKYSIKAVLPAVVPDMREAYTSLTIREGGTASNAFLQMLSGEYAGSVEQARADLLRYCELDTWAMVKILERIMMITSAPGPTSAAAAPDSTSDAGGTSEHRLSSITLAANAIVDDTVGTGQQSGRTAQDDVELSLESLVLSACSESPGIRQEAADEKSPNGPQGKHTVKEQPIASSAGSVALNDCESSSRSECSNINGFNTCSAVSLDSCPADGESKSKTGRCRSPLHAVDNACEPSGPALVQCVRKDGRLCVNVISEGYDTEKECQFPSFLREEGKIFLVCEIKDAGSYYRVKGSIVPQP